MVPYTNRLVNVFFCKHSVAIQRNKPNISNPFEFKKVRTHTNLRVLQVDFEGTDSLYT